VLEKLTVRGFKSLTCVEEVELPRMSVLLGPNAVGKSNLVDAIQVLSRLATSRTLSEALSEPLRGYPIEAFSFPPEGLSSLLQQSFANFEIDATLRIGKERFQYRIKVRINPASGSLSVDDEFLAALTATGATKGNAIIEKIDDQLRIRRKSKPAHPRQEPLGLNHTILSDPRLGGPEYRAIISIRELPCDSPGLRPPCRISAPWATRYPRFCIICGAKTGNALTQCSAPCGPLFPPSKASKSISTTVAGRWTS